MKGNSNQYIFNLPKNNNNTINQNNLDLQDDTKILNVKKENLYVNYKNLEGINNELNFKNEELVGRIKNLENKINIIETNNLTLSKQNKTNQLQLEKKELKLQEAYNEINKQKENIRKLEENNKKLREDLDNTKKELESKVKEFKEKMSKFNGVLHHFDNIDNQIQDKDNKLQNLNKENELLKKEKKELNERILKYQSSGTKEKFMNTEAHKFYDVIIDITSINSLENEGWAIKYNEENKATYDKIVGDETMKIGVLGLNNVGKSYLLSKLVNIEIPTGYSIETKGISIKYSKPKGDDDEEIEGICILDSAGFETPLLRENEENKKEVDKLQESINNIKQYKSNDVENAIKYDRVEDDLARDKAQTERFIEQLIISLSDMLILVIGKLTRTEQRLINRIKNMAKRNEKNKIKSIIIVHNLSQYHKICEVEQHIKQYLKKSATFKLTQRNYIGNNQNYKGRTYLYDNSDESKEIVVYHFLMAKEGTEAGDYYNPFTLQLIKQQFNTFNERRSIDIPNEITKLFSELSTDIIGKKMECQKVGEKNNIIKLIEDKETKHKEKKRIQIRDAYIDQDGNYLKKGKFEPKYSLYYYEKYLLLRLEIPGNIIRLTARSTDPKTEKFNGIVIKGIKKKDDFEERSKEDFTKISDNRNYDDFSYFIELERNLELSKTGAKGNTGIYEIKFDKRNKEKFFTKENNQNTIIKEKNENKNEDTKENTKDLIKVASGVYVMKFLLTDRSFNS